MRVLITGNYLKFFCKMVQERLGIPYCFHVLHDIFILHQLVNKFDLVLQLCQFSNNLCSPMFQVLNNLKRDCDDF